MKEPTQGTGAHLPHGSITAEINRLRLDRDATVTRLRAENFDLSARVRLLEAALRDLAGPAARAVRVLEASHG